MILKRWSPACLAALIVLGGAFSAGAAIVNNRPIWVNPNSWDGVANNLQHVLDNITTQGHIQVNGLNGDQVPYAVFTNDATGGAVATMIIELAGNAPVNEFGLYQYGNPGNLRGVPGC